MKINHLKLIITAFIVLFGYFPIDSALSTEISISKGELNFSSEELSWLKSNKSIKIGGPKAFPPFHYYDENENLKGISADYIFMIMNQLGIKLEVEKNLPWPEVLTKAKTGEIDLIACVAKTEDREDFLNFSTPYLSFPLVILNRRDTPFIGGIEDLHNKSLAVIKKNVIVTWLQRDQIRFEPYYVESPLKVLEAISLGRVDAGIENLAAASYIIQKFGLTNVKIAAPTPYGNYNLHMAVRKDLPELLTIINKVIEWITPEQHMEIRSGWLSVRYEHGIRKTDILRWTFVIGFVVCIIVAVILIWNRKLQKEIAARKIIEAELKHIASTDSLTGADNRRSFWEKSERELERSKRYNHPFSFLMMDIDYFKSVNDTYGHGGGDRVLKALVTKSNKFIRNSDIFGRLGGEEFAIILTETKVETAKEVGERLRKELSEIRIDSEQGPIQITVSLGLAMLDKKTDSIEDIMNRADAALYRAKETGRNRLIQA